MKKGFTLAEVLITLGIIGVVAAMTLPALISNHKNSELRSSLLKNYSAISQALDMYQADTGERITPGNCKARELKTSLSSYMQVSKAKPLTKYINDYTNYTNKSNLNYGLFDDGIFALNDGSLYFFENGGQRLFITVDINGYFKKPNRLGHDLFMFQINSLGKLLPMGAKETMYYNVNSATCSKNSIDGMNGAGCTINAIMDKDYFKKLPK